MFAAACAACGGLPQDPDCQFVESGYGPVGSASVRVEVVARGLEVPWGIAFLPGGDLLVTERPGRVRLVRAGQLVAEPVATLAPAADGEGGLLGIAIAPDFEQSRSFYLYVTATEGGAPVNRVERWRLAPDARSASRDRVILGGIPSVQYHDGGRIRFGPDGMLYVSTGDAGRAEASQSMESLSGKLLRLTPEGAVPTDNPFPGSPIFVLGIRNSQGFDWRDARTLFIADHGPTGERGRAGADEVNVAEAGANLGWPEVYRCERAQGLVAPSLTFRSAVPPGGAAVYTGDAIPEWKGSLLVGTLASKHLHRVAFEPAPSRRVAAHEVFLLGDPPDGFGRLREVAMGPDGATYLTTSNCDGRTACPADKDLVLRIAR